MKVAIVGSRTYPTADHIFEFIDNLPTDVEIVSGGAGGPDSWAVWHAKKRGMPTRVFPADWHTHGKRAGFLRNQTIVDRADVVVAFWDGESRGTADTIAKARAAGKHCEVITPSS